jgi:hypothetical protein
LLNDYAVFLLPVKIKPSIMIIAESSTVWIITPLLIAGIRSVAGMERKSKMVIKPLGATNNKGNIGSDNNFSDESGFHAVSASGKHSIGAGHLHGRG